MDGQLARLKMHFILICSRRMLRRRTGQLPALYESWTPSRFLGMSSTAFRVGERTYLQDLLLRRQ